MAQATQQYIYIDDSGDPGLSASSSSLFIIASVIMANRIERNELELIIDKYRQELGWHELHEFKFNKTSKKIARELLRKVSGCDFQAYAIVIDKRTLDRNLGQEIIYNETIKELLVSVPLDNPVITIDGRSNRHTMRQTASYLRQGLKQAGISVKRVRFSDSRKDSLVQLADIVAGSVGRSYQYHKTDAEDFVKLIGNKLKVLKK